MNDPPEMALWGLEEGDGLLLSSLLVVLRVPGILLLDFLLAIGHLELPGSDFTATLLEECAKLSAAVGGATLAAGVGETRLFQGLLRSEFTTKPRKKTGGH